MDPFPLSEQTRRGIKALGYTHSFDIVNLLLVTDELSFTGLLETLSTDTRSLQNTLLKLRDAAIIQRRFRYTESERRSFYSLTTYGRILLNALIKIEYPDPESTTPLTYPCEASAKKR